ncbi:MAG: hypothetical protein OHK0017_10120 [Patescibacteria group bacterium]
MNKFNSLLGLCALLFGLFAFTTVTTLAANGTITVTNNISGNSNNVIALCIDNAVTSPAVTNLTPGSSATISGTSGSHTLKVVLAQYFNSGSICSSNSFPVISSTNFTLQDDSSTSVSISGSPVTSNLPIYLIEGSIGPSVGTDLGLKANLLLPDGTSNNVSSLCVDGVLTNEGEAGTGVYDLPVGPHSISYPNFASGLCDGSNTNVTVNISEIEQRTVNFTAQYNNDYSINGLFISGTGPVSILPNNPDSTVTDSGNNNTNTSNPSSTTNSSNSTTVLSNAIVNSSISSNQIQTSGNNVMESLGSSAQDLTRSGAENTWVNILAFSILGVMAALTTLSVLPSKKSEVHK